MSYSKYIINEGVDGRLSSFPPRGSDVTFSCVVTNINDGREIERVDNITERLNENKLPEIWETILPTMKMNEECVIQTDTERMTLTLHSWINTRLVTPRGEVKKEVYVSAMDPLRKPTIWSIVNCCYTVKLTKSKEIIKHFDGDVHLKYDKDIIWGIEEALNGMGAGEKAEVTIKPPYCFGYDDDGLIVDVELKSWKDDQKLPYDMNPNEVADLCIVYKDRANFFFRQGDLERASSLYTDALNLMDDYGGYDNDDLIISLNTNMAVISSKNKLVSDTILYCTRVLKSKYNHKKCLLLRGRAYTERNDFELAEKDLKLLPKSRTVDNLLAYIEKQKKKVEKLQQEKFQNLFERANIY